MIRGRTLSAALTANDRDPWILLIHETLLQAIRDARRRDPLRSAPALDWLNAHETRELALAIGIELPTGITREQLCGCPYPQRPRGGKGFPRKTRRVYANAN